MTLVASFSFSFCCCRSCLATRDTIFTHFCSDDFDSRTQDEHLRQTEMLNGPLENHYSKTYGINRKSALLTVIDFKMFGGGLPHDAIHDIFEGIAPLEIQLLLSHFVTSSLLIVGSLTLIMDTQKMISQYQFFHVCYIPNQFVHQQHK